MKPRERVLTAVAHREPDRIPIDIGGSGISSGSEKLQSEMRQILGIKEDKDPHFPYFDNAIQKYFGVDFRQIGLHGPKNFVPRRDEQGRELDEYGVWDYKDAHCNPLHDATIEDLKTFPWPDPYDPGRIEGLKEEAKFLHTQTDYAVVANTPGHGFFEGGCRWRGYEQFLLDFAINQDWVKAFFDIHLQNMNKFIDVYMGEIGEYIDIIWLGDDACTQRGPYISPKQYRELVKPYFREYIQHIKKYTKAKIMHHCCGASFTLIPDYLDIGIEILNPIQPEAAGMSPQHLKETFGDRMTFHGGIGLQSVLSKGSKREIEEITKGTARILGKGGGYILAAAHTPPDDILTENVVVMLETAKNLTYPL